MRSPLHRSQPPMRPAGWLPGRVAWLALLPCLLASVPAAQAGSITASSVWDRQNALERARQQMPAGTTETRQRCQDIAVGTGNYHYRCTVWFTPAASDAPPPQAP